MDIASIKTVAWELYDVQNDALSFEFKGKKIIYPWLDYEKECFELTTPQAIEEYGYENILNLCKTLAPICGNRVQSPEEWANSDVVNLKAYRRWLENGVYFENGRIEGKGIPENIATLV